ncbi:MAG: hypothetical protein AAB840_00490, partial [Patescibacteria group bacterium]
LDILSVSPIGQTPLVTLLVYFIVDLYKKAFELRDWRALLIILIIATYIYARIFSYEANLFLFMAIFGGAAIFINYFTRGKIWLK